MHICCDNRSCQSVADPCFVPVEGIVATTVGPAQSGLIGLTYGIVSQLVAVITLAVTMGCYISKPYDGDSYCTSAESPPPTPCTPCNSPCVSPALTLRERWELEWRIQREIFRYLCYVEE